MSNHLLQRKRGAYVAGLAKAACVKENTLHHPLRHTLGQIESGRNIRHI